MKRAVTDDTKKENIGGAQIHTNMETKEVHKEWMQGRREQVHNKKQTRTHSE